MKLDSFPHAGKPSRLNSPGEVLERERDAITCLDRREILYNSRLQSRSCRVDELSATQ